MHNLLNIEPEAFEFEAYDSTGEGRQTSEFEAPQSWEFGSPYSNEFDFEGEAATPSSTNQGASPGCASYERGEVQKSMTAQGHLTDNAGNLYAHATETCLIRGPRAGAHPIAR